VSAVDGVSAVDRVSAVDGVGGVDGTGGVDEGGGVGGVGGVGGEGGLSSEGARGPWWGARCGRRGQSGRPGGGASARPYGSRGVGATGWLEWPPRCWGARRARRLGRPNRPPPPHPLAPRGWGGGAVGPVGVLAPLLGRPPRAATRPSQPPPAAPPTGTARLRGWGSRGGLQARAGGARLAGRHCQPRFIGQRSDRRCAALKPFRTGRGVSSEGEIERLHSSERLKLRSQGTELVATDGRAKNGTRIQKAVWMRISIRIETGIPRGG